MLKEEDEPYFELVVGLALVLEDRRGGGGRGGRVDIDYIVDKSLRKTAVTFDSASFIA